MPAAVLRYNTIDTESNLVILLRGLTQAQYIGAQPPELLGCIKWAGASKS